MKIIKTIKGFFIIFFASIIISSSITGILLYNLSLQQKVNNNNDESGTNDNKANLKLNISSLSMVEGDDGKSDINYKNSYSHKNYGDLEFIHTSNCDHNDHNPAEDYIEECEDNQLVNGYYLIRQLIRERGILFYDVLKRINSDPINGTFSDEITYSAKIRTIFCNPIPGINITYYIFNHSDSYPKWIARHYLLSKIYDQFWFYLYFYNSPALVEYLNSSCVGRWLLSMRNKILNHFWVEKIDSSLTDINGTSEINQFIYYNPGKYNIITVANIKDFSTLITSEHDCDYIDHNFFDSCCKSKKNIDFLLFRIFYNHLTVKQETSEMEFVHHHARYSDISNFTVLLTDDENYPLLKPYPWNHDNYASHPTVLLSDKLDINYYIHLPDTSHYLGTTTTDPYGYATLSVPIWIRPGNYNMTVIFEGNACYLPTSVTSEIIIKKEFTKIEPIQLYKVNNTDECVLSAQLLDDEDIDIPQLEDLDQEGRIIAFYIEIEDEWSFIGQSKTDSTGWCNLTASFLLPYGTYPFKVIFYGDDYYQSSESVGIIEINREQTILSNLNNVNIQTTDYVILLANLTDNELNPIENKSISFSILEGLVWNNLGTSFTNQEGLVKFYWEVSTAPGTYIIKAEFEQDDYFTSAQAYAIASIEKEDTLIKITTKLSDLYGNYDIIAQLVEDDPTQEPISDKDIILRINGERYERMTDENGYAKVPISLISFEDISIEVEYDGSTYFKSSHNQFIKTFGTEWDAFNDYSLDMIVNLFNDYSSLEVDKISSVANAFFNFKEDIKDGKLSSASNLQLFFSLIGLPFEVVLLGDNTIELRDFSYFLDPISGGDGIVTLTYLGMDFDILFNPNDYDQPYAGQEFTFEHLFEWMEDDHDWVFHTISLSIDEFLRMIGKVLEDLKDKLYEFWYDDHPYQVDIDIIGGIPILDWAKKGYWEKVGDHLEQYLMIKNIVLSIPGDLIHEWNDRRSDLFWKWFGDVLKLGFKYMAENYENIGNNILDLLELIGIDVYEILEDILQWLNKEKVDQMKSELLEDFDTKLDHVLDKIEDIEFLNYGKDFNALLLGDNLVLEATSIMSINPLMISLDDDFTESDLFDEIASKFSLITGLLVDGNELKDLFDNLCEIIDQDITLQIPGNNISLDTTEIEEILTGWYDLNKIGISDISDINNIIFGLEGIDEISTNDIIDVIDLITQTIGGLDNIFIPIFEGLLYFLAENDPWFASRTNYDISLLIALIMHIINIIFDVLDALNYFPDVGIFDEIISLIIGIAIGYCGYNAKIKTDDSYKEKNAEYIEVIGAYISVQAYFELDTQIYYGDLMADKAGSVVEIVLDIISVCSTYWHFYEQGDVDWDALLWAIIDGVINFPDAALPLVKDYDVALGICIAASAIGITLLIIRLTNPGRWI